LPGPEQDAGDQEAREQAEEIDAGPAHGRDDRQRFFELRISQSVVRRVVEHDQQDRETAKPAEARVARIDGRTAVRQCILQAGAQLRDPRRKDAERS
jgi:hypothetical protein